MLYHYYMKMKINLLRSLFFACIFFLPYAVRAQVTVVRAQGNQVYLDTSSLSRKVHTGEKFKIILSTEKLINPQTGKDLGDLYHYSPEGQITEVQPLYAVGTLPENTSVSIGQKAILEDLAPAAVTPAVKPDAPSATQASTSTKNKLVYAPIDQTIISLSTGPVLAEHAHNVVTLSDSGLVTVWTRGEDALRENTTYQFSHFQTPLSVSVAALTTPEKADIFVAYFDNRQDRIFTTILRYQDNQLQEIQTIPYFVKEHGCRFHKTLWAQKAFANGIHPGRAHKLLYENGKFTTDNDSYSTQQNWLPSTVWFPAEKDQDDNLIYTSSSGKIVMVLSNGKQTESKSLFAAAPNRIKYKQKIVKLYPSLQVYGSPGNALIAGVENTSKLGLLSSTFGQYKNGKIHFLTYEKGQLKIKDSVELDGVVYDTACTPSTLLAAEVLPNGTSSVVEIFN